jgi:hypothetical protein
MRWQAGRLRATALGLATTGFMVAGLLPSGLQPAGAVVPGTNGRIAFARGAAGAQDIYSMNPDGTGVAPLVVLAGADDTEPAYSPDGTKIAFASNRFGDYDIYVANADGSAPAQITATADVDHAPTWSPNGAQIAFVRGGPGAGEIMVVNSNGTGPVINVSSNAADDIEPDWSSSNLLAYASNRVLNLSADYEIYTSAPTAAAAATPLTDNGAGVNDRAPAWSPSAAEIAFQSTRPAATDNDIWKMNADGTLQAQLTMDPADDFNPAWSPQGDQITFRADRAGAGDIFTMTNTGNSQTNRTSNPALEDFPNWGSAVAPLPPGTGNITVNPASLNFGEVEVGTVSAPQTVTVKNNGPGDAFVKSVGITAGAPEYVVSSDTCSPKPFKLAPGATCAVSVTFQPATTGTRTGNLQIVDQPINVPLTGVGVEFEEDDFPGDGDGDGDGEGGAGAGGAGAGSGGGAGQCGGGGGGFGGTGTGAGDDSEGSAGGSGGSSTSTSCADSEANAGEGGNADGGAGGNAQGAQGGAGGGNTNNNTPATNTCNGMIVVACNTQLNVVQVAGNGGAGGGGGTAPGGNGGTANGGNASSNAGSSSESSSDGGYGGNGGGSSSSKPKKKKKKVNCKKRKNKHRNACKNKRRSRR